VRSVVLEVLQPQGRRRARRYLNYTLAERRFKERAEVLDSYPYHAFIDPSTICNLRCPFCAVGRGIDDQPKRLMKIDEFKRIMNMVGKYLYQVEIYHYGEPLLNPDIYGMIEHAKTYGVCTRISTNANVLNQERAERLVGSGLDYLTLSIDGASPESYSKYRVGGDFDKVMENVRFLVAAKKNRNSQTPRLVWQFLLFKHNEHEVGIAKALAEKMGVDIFSLMPAYIPPEERDWMPSREFAQTHGLAGAPEKSNEALPSSGVCKWLWTHLVVNSSGAISPCCRRTAPRGQFGNILQVESFLDLWNGDGFRSARRFFATGTSQAPKTICETCPIETRDIIPFCFELPHTPLRRSAGALYGTYKNIRRHFTRT
jgi:MoaA/NifB/PqqE/SkfB family radical SAM enzyme